MDNLIPIQLTGDGEAKMIDYLDKRTRQLKSQFEQIFRSKYTAWRRIYNAKPLEEVREYPFHNASNLVIPVVAIHTDTLLARIMAAIFKTRPLWSCSIVGDSGDPDMESARKALEDALVYNALESSELDLYRVEREFFSDTIKYGHATVKSLWERFVYEKAIPGGDSLNGFTTAPITLYEGPRPEKIPYEDFMATVNAKTLETADLKIHVLHLQRHQLEERAFLGLYDKQVVADLLKSPDMGAPDEVERQKLADANIQQTAGYDYQEWILYECWYDYWIENKKFKVIATFHPRSKTILRLVYNPFDVEVFVDANLFKEDDLVFGMGFAEKLGNFQEEISQMHNQRRDANTVANCSMLRVSPDSKLNAGFRIFPGVMLPAEKDEVEPLKFGEPSTLSIDDERLTLDLAERRTGVSQPQQGLGAGTFNKRGVYSAMGTLSLLQEGDNRTSLNISDIRYSHAKLGRLLAYEYSLEGTKGKFAMFGDTKATLIMRALQAYASKRLALSIAASQASVNREVEKQNDLMLSNIMRQHYQAIAGYLAQIASPMTPPNVKEYLEQAIHASNILMEDVLRVFDKSEPERMVPEPNVQQPAGQPTGPQPGGASGPPGMAQPPNGQAIPGIPEMGAGAPGQGPGKIQ